MLNDITIQNYRCFKNFHINSLARVNLIVGMNNSGKTSLLEAIYLLISQKQPRVLGEILDNRGEVIERLNLGITGKPEKLELYYQITSLFHNYQTEAPQIINLETTDSKRCLQIKLEKNNLHNQIIDNQIEANLTPYKLVLNFDSGQIILPVYEDGSIDEKFMQYFKQSPSFTRQISYLVDTQKNIFITTNNLNFGELAALWNKITLTPKEDKVIEALQILEPDIQRINFTSQANINAGILVKLRGKYPIPLVSMGEGMRRVLQIAIAAVTVENGFLLIDEIETGLYYQSQTDMWNFILKVAKKLNIQVFATTHSWDCITAFQEALELSNDNNSGKLFRLSRQNEDIGVVEYSSNELSTAVNHSIEVR
ncbi:MAG: ATP-binding protein [Cyanobacteriota bacterium]|nr:ATP-binding protein [Cyanobacteriota bacterium]